MAEYIFQKYKKAQQIGLAVTETIWYNKPYIGPKLINDYELVERQDPIFFSSSTELSNYNQFDIPNMGYVSGEELLLWAQYGQGWNDPDHPGEGREGYPEGTFWKIDHYWVNSQKWAIWSTGPTPNNNPERKLGWKFECAPDTSYYIAGLGTPQDIYITYEGNLNEFDTLYSDGSSPYYWVLVSSPTTAVVENAETPEPPHEHYPITTDENDSDSSHWYFDEEHHWARCIEEDGYPATFEEAQAALYKEGTEPNVEYHNWPCAEHNFTNGDCICGKTAPQEEVPSSFTYAFKLTFINNKDDTKIPDEYVIGQNNPIAVCAVKDGIIIDSIIYNHQNDYTDDNNNNTKVEWNESNNQEDLVGYFTLPANETYSFYIRSGLNVNELLEWWNCDGPILSNVVITQNRVYIGNVHAKYAKRSPVIAYVEPTITYPQIPVNVDLPAIIGPSITFDYSNEPTATLNYESSGSELIAIYIDEERVWEQKAYNDKYLYYCRNIPVTYFRNGTKWEADLEGINMMTCANLKEENVLWIDPNGTETVGIYFDDDLIEKPVDSNNSESTDKQYIITEENNYSFHKCELKISFDENKNNCQLTIYLRKEGVENG